MEDIIISVIIKQFTRENLTSILTCKCSNLQMFCKYSEFSMCKSPFSFSLSNELKMEYFVSQEMILVHNVKHQI